MASALSYWLRERNLVDRGGGAVEARCWELVLAYHVEHVSDDAEGDSGG
jgi:hypothetical protein